MKLIIVGGFLGSGKTSLILSLAHFLVEEQAGPQNLVIIENEIGEIGIDNQVLKAAGLQVKELFAGCICCTLSADLVVTLNEIEEKIKPDWVVFEPTGLAYPGKIKATINQYAPEIGSIKTVAIVDAERWDELLEVTPTLLETQVKDADIILINKIDLVDPEVLNHIERQVISFNDAAVVYKVSAYAQIEESVWKGVAGNA